MPDPHDSLAWTTIAGAPLPRAGAAVGLVGDQIVVAGGTYWKDGIKYWTDQVDAFDPTRRTWQHWPSLPAPRGDTSGLVHDGRFWLIGGGTQEPAVASVVAWTDGRWTESTEMRLPAPRRSAMAAVIGDEIFVLGGLAGKGTEFDTATGTLWSARPGSSWRNHAPLPAPVRFGAAVAALGSRLLLAGGCTPEPGGAVRNLDEILAYDPETDRWSVVGRLPVPLRGAWGLAVRDRMLVLGGYATEFLRDILAVDAQGRVTPAGRLPVALADERICCHGETLVGVTGEDGIKRRFPDLIMAPLPVPASP